MMSLHCWHEAGVLDRQAAMGLHAGFHGTYLASLPWLWLAVF
jgi:hypothetical protein